MSILIRFVTYLIKMLSKIFKVKTKKNDNDIREDKRTEPPDSVYPMW